MHDFQACFFLREREREWPSPSISVWVISKQWVSPIALFALCLMMTHIARVPSPAKELLSCRNSRTHRDSSAVSSPITAAHYYLHLPRGSNLSTFHRIHGGKQVWQEYRKNDLIGVTAGGFHRSSTNNQMNTVMDDLRTL